MNSQLWRFLEADFFPVRGGRKSAEGALQAGRPFGFSRPFWLLFAAMAKSNKRKKPRPFPYQGLLKNNIGNFSYLQRINIQVFIL